ncbi:glycosyltransferase family 4 protein [Chloroflexota bacterium]
MQKSLAHRLCILPKLKGIGGMVSFQHKLVEGMTKRGVDVCYELSDLPYEGVLVIGGTRQLIGLRRVLKMGIPIVQRLDGMNWLHRVRRRKSKRHINLRHYLRAEYGNIILMFIRTHLADKIVYQSEFARNWWERVHGPTPVPDTVIHNGVDLDTFFPIEPSLRPLDRYRLLLVEGSLMGGYEQGLGVAVELVKKLSDRHNHDLGMGIELMVVGRVLQDVQSQSEQYINRINDKKSVSLTWIGLVPGEKIAEIDNSAHLLYSADVNPACPNSVIEALACGTPVLSFDTGALPELVKGDAGRIVPYGGDSWKLDPPDVKALACAAVEILTEQERFRIAARERAESAFNVTQMVDSYLDVLLQQ